jgi:hypothetical protein
MANQQKNRKSHKTDALMRLLMSGSGGAVNPSVSVTFKEDIIRPINDKKHLPIQEQKPVSPPQFEKPRVSFEKPHTDSERDLPAGAAPPPPPPQIENLRASFEKPQTDYNRDLPAGAAPLKFSPERPAELDIVRELIKELLPTAIQRFNVCYCDTCYGAMTDAVLKRSPKIIILVRSKDDLARAEYLKKQNRNNVLRTVIKEVLDYKTSGKHNNNVRI